MFWRKKEKETKPLFSYEDDPSCRREYIRISPPSWAPINIQLGEETVQLIDISAGGLACFCHRVKVGQIHQVEILLPGEKVAISASVRVLGVTDNKTCHCMFLDLTEEMMDTIHHYVLNVQKEELRRKRTRTKEE